VQPAREPSDGFRKILRWGALLFLGYLFAVNLPQLTEVAKERLQGAPVAPAVAPAKPSPVAVSKPVAPPVAPKLAPAPQTAVPPLPVIAPPPVAAETVPAAPGATEAVMVPVVDEARMALLDQKLAALSQQVTDLQAAEARKAQAVMALNALWEVAATVDSGAPFGSQWQRLKDQAANTSLAAALLSAPEWERVATHGIATPAQLVRGWRVWVNRLREVQAMPPQDASLWQRVQYQARSLVVVRRTDGVEATALDARAAQVEQLLRSGRLTEALATAEALAAERKVALPDAWQKALQQRQRWDEWLAAQRRALMGAA
jgi:hypothetical protein